MQFIAYVNDLGDDFDFEISGTLESIKKELVDDLKLISEEQFEVLKNNNWLERGHVNISLNKLGGLIMRVYSETKVKQGAIISLDDTLGKSFKVIACIDLSFLDNTLKGYILSLKEVF
jgi:hypothetical protein